MQFIEFNFYSKLGQNTAKTTAESTAETSLKSSHFDDLILKYKFDLLRPKLRPKVRPKLALYRQNLNFQHFPCYGRNLALIVTVQISTLDR